jgi:desulfoferrodoxin (superoxide reductase-like protein)
MEKIIRARLVLLTFFMLLIFLCIPPFAVANKSAVTIEAPEKAEIGSEIIIRINVRHSGNNLFHYTESASVTINGKEVKKWEFSSFKKPETEKFSREIRYRVDGPLEIVAGSNCNVHGSAGPAKKIVAVR